MSKQSTEDPKKPNEIKATKYPTKTSMNVTAQAALFCYPVNSVVKARRLSRFIYHFFLLLFLLLIGGVFNGLFLPLQDFFRDFQRVERFCCAGKSFDVLPMGIPLSMAM